MNIHSGAVLYKPFITSSPASGFHNTKPMVAKDIIIIAITIFLVALIATSYVS